MVPLVRNLLLLLTALLALGLLLTRQQPTAIPVPSTPPAEASEFLLSDPTPDPSPDSANPKTATPVKESPRTVADANPVKAPTARDDFADLEAERRHLAAVIANWRFQDYRRFSNSAQIQGEGAYQAYLYLKSCVGSETTAASYEAKFARIQVFYAEGRYGVSADQLESALKQLEAGFIRCQGVGETPLEAAIEWLQLAADLGYLPAQIGFYQELPELLRQDRWAVFRQPELVELYRQRSPDYLQLALQTGHPEAFRNFAEAILEGVVFEPDPLLAAAYHHAADLAQSSGDLSPGTADLGLGPRQLREARRIGKDLCAKYCR